MQLHYTPSSPYARKVRALALLLEIDDFELVRTNPMADKHLRLMNPLGKVPVLVDNELTLFASNLICEYLDEYYNHGNLSYLRRGTQRYYSVQKIHALADGTLDAALAIVMEQRRSDAEQSAFWLDRWQSAIIHGVQAAEVRALGGGDDIHMGTIAMACALGYLDFRLPQLNWRQSNGELGQWYEQLEQLHWLRQTAPSDG